MNKVLKGTARKSSNFYYSDKILQHFLSSEISVMGLSFMHEKLVKTGQSAAQEIDQLSLQADRYPPQLIYRDFYGETVNKIDYHPAYHQLKKLAVETGMFEVKWANEWRERFQLERNALSFSSSFLFAMSECGLYCPLCMTDGVATLIDNYCTEDDKDRLLPHIAASDVKQLYTGAMFLTEKAGGSDVGANMVSATKVEKDLYNLNGEKWFCSNADAEIIFALARTDPTVKGTKGLSIFMIEKTRPDGQPNNLGYIRLKNKLGVRSMASAECLLENVPAKIIGKEGQGFAIMTNMINLSRLYNSVAALACMRRALVEAYEFLSFRDTFGKAALSHALIRTKLYELTSVYQANFYLTWHCIKLLDAAENNDDSAAELLRLLTPMCKKTSAAQSVYVIRECMELMGGLGYIEDGVLPKIYRDALVLPIWEGAGNIMVLDMLRASMKSKGLKLLWNEIHNNCEGLDADKKAGIHSKINSIKEAYNKLYDCPQATVEASAKPIFEQLTQIYQISLLVRYRDEHSSSWMDGAIDYFIDQIQNPSKLIVDPPSQAQIENMMAWDIQ